MLFLLSACSADPWEDTRSTCGFSDGETLPWTALSPPEDGVWNDLRMPSGCPDRLLADLGADSTQLLDDIGETDDLDAHVEAVRSGTLPLDGVTVAVWGMYWLLGGDFGDASSVPEGPYADDEWREFFLSEAGEVGSGAPLSSVFYAFVASRTKDVQYAANAEPGLVAQMEWWSGTLRVPRFFDPDLSWSVAPWEPDESAKGLVHEATHAPPNQVSHVECEAPARLAGRNCDEDLTGAYGAGFYLAWAEVGAATGGAGCLSGEDVVADARARYTEERLRTDWDWSVMQAVPAEQLADCEGSR